MNSFLIFSTLRNSSDPGATPLHTLPPLLHTAAQYNPNIFNGMRMCIVDSLCMVFAFSIGQAVFI
jgi:hypothetical protein